MVLGLVQVVYGQGLQTGQLLNYPLNGDFLDYSVNQNHGVNNGGSLVADNCNNPGFAGNFAGNGFMTIPFKANLQAQLPLSFRFRMKFSSYNSSTVYLLWGTNEPLPTDAGYKGVYANYFNGQIFINLGNGLNFTATGRRTFSATHAINLNQWYEVTVVISSATNCQMWVDCAAKTVVASGPINPISYSANNGHLGKAFFPPNGTTSYFNQQLDQFRMWNRALTASEVASLCAADTVVYAESTCQPVSVFGQTFEAPTDTTFPIAPGCNQFYRVKLNEVIPTFTFSASASLCPNIPYFFFGTIYTAPQDTTIISANCDSVLTLLLIERNCDTTNVIDTLCPGQAYTLGSTDFFAPFTGYIKPPGSDSTVFLRLYEGFPTNIDTVEFIGCPGETVDTLGLTLPFPFMTPVYSANCDSVVWLNGMGIAGCRKHCEAFVPSSFTPNADGLNDALGFTIPYEAELTANRVFNRWGQLIFETKDPTLFWDGTYQGQPAPEGVYYLRVQYRCNESNEEYVGFVTLLR
jgi:gliding motility-associated-like protein